MIYAFVGCKFMKFSFSRDIKHKKTATLKGEWPS